MKTIKSCKLKEVLSSKGMDEGAIADFFKSIKIAKKKNKLDKLTNDPKYQAILKKYDIEPVPYGKDFSLGDLKSFKK